MNTVLIGSETVELLSLITGERLNQKDITPPVVFLASLVTILLGVIYADGTVAEEEKERLLKSLYRFSIPESDVRRLTHLMIKGVKENQIYTKFNELQLLTASLSEPQKLLLISFGYEMSAADGEIDAREKGYLQLIANQLDIDRRYQEVLEAVFSSKANIDQKALNTVQNLLDPSRFQSLDIVFVNAANDMLAALSSQSVYQTTQQHTNQQPKTKSYGEFKKFQEDCKQVDRLCYKLFQIIQSCIEHSLVSNSLKDEVIKVSRKIQSHGFRVAVLGEFSQGKSTLLNALLGEKIQPVRAIPCSGAITVLKYGSKREIICRYKDGREEEISLEQYQVKASIPKEAACNGLSDGLANSNIAEIIFKHPDLELCRNGVEIIDSPGLNEHPERTSITQRLLKDTDAVIFLGNASRPLTQWEKDYLVKDLRVQLNGGKENLPADNLFVVVNFMDLLDEEEDRQDVTKRFQSFVQGNSPIVTGVNRLHFISAKAALKSIIDGIEDEHSKTFQGFTKSLEKFLTLERGRLKIKQSIVNLDNLIKSSLNELAQAEAILDGKIKLSEGEQHKILEDIGEASGRDLKIHLLKDELIKPMEQQIIDAWNHWLGVEDGGLKKRLKEKSKTWTSEHSPIWNRDKLAEDYARQFSEALSEELKLWINKQLKEAILMPPLKILDNSIEEELKQIKAGIKNWNQQIHTKLPTCIFLNENSKATADEWFLGSLGFAGLAVALIPVIVIAGPLVTIIASVSAGMFGTVGVSMMASVSNTIKEKVFDFGYEQFSASIIKTISQIKNSAKTEFEERVDKASEVIAEAISFYQGILEQQEKAHKETLQERAAEKAFVTQQRQQLEQVQKEMEVIINQIVG